MYQRADGGFGGAGGSVSLAMSAAMPAPAFGRRPNAEPRRLLPDTDLVVDLGHRIGSREWWRGLATLALLLAIAWMLSPTLRPIVAASPPAYGESEWDEARAQAIAPLANGADTGRRMAPTQAVQPLAESPERPRVDLTATLGMGDGFEHVLTRAGVSDAEAARIAAMVGSTVPLASLKAGTHVDLTLGRRANRQVARPLDHLLFRAAFDLKLAVERVNGRLELQRLPIAIDNTPLRVEGRVGSSLYLAARESGAPSGAVAAYIRAIATRVSIGRDVDADDRFDIIVSRRRAATGETEMGDLVYAGLDHAGKRIGLMRWAQGGKDQWFEQSGVGETTGGMKMPVAGHLTSSFGMRFHPILGFSRLHAGIDIGAPTGTPIIAATDGTVTYAGWHGGHGNFVQVKQSAAFGTGYGHMSRIIARVGQHVQAGELIGYVGMTGLATGPHLHFEVYQDGHPVNPMTVKYNQTAQLAGADLAAFRARLAQLMAVRMGAESSVAPKPDGGLAAAATTVSKHPG